MIQALAGNIIGLFLLVQRTLSEPYRFHYTQLHRLLSPILSEEEINGLVRSFFDTAESKDFGKGEGVMSVSSNVRIVALSRKIAKELDFSQKITFITVLLKLISKSSGAEAKAATEIIKTIADLMSIPLYVCTSLASLTKNELPLVDDFANSIYVSNAAPDYNQVLLGLKHYNVPEIGFSFWLKYFKEFDYFIVKIGEVYSSDNRGLFNAGDILASDHLVRSILSKARLSEAELKVLLSGPVTFPERIEIAATDMTPLIILDATKYKIEMEGASIPLAPLRFFEPVIRWIDIIAARRPAQIEIHLRLNYFNTYTSKIILEIFLKLKNLELLNCDAQFYWYHEPGDYEIKEAGEYYSEILNKEFKIVELQTG